MKLMDDLAIPMMSAQQQTPPSSPAPSYQPPVLQTRPQVESYAYPRQPYSPSCYPPGYVYRSPALYYAYPAPRTGAGITYSARSARYYPNTYVKR